MIKVDKITQVLHMLRLHVMRHAKSSWAVPGASDFDRELSDRGLSDLKRVATEIEAKGLIPEKILCSSAVRTRQTLDGISPALTPAPQIEYLDKLYSGGVEDYLTAIRATTGCKSLMTVGHNPMSGSLASSLAGDGDPKAWRKSRTNTRLQQLLSLILTPMTGRRSTGRRNPGPMHFPI